MSGISGSWDFGSPLFAPVSASGSGATTVVTGVPGKKLRVMAANVIASNTVNVKWQTQSGADLTGLAYVTQYSGYILGYCPIGWFETVAGDDLLINLSSGVPVGGHITYILA